MLARYERVLQAKLRDCQETLKRQVSHSISSRSHSPSDRHTSGREFRLRRNVRRSDSSQNQSRPNPTAAGLTPLPTVATLGVSFGKAEISDLLAKPRGGHLPHAAPPLGKEDAERRHFFPRAEKRSALGRPPQVHSADGLRARVHPAGASRQTPRSGANEESDSVDRRRRAAHRSSSMVRHRCLADLLGATSGSQRMLWRASCIRCCRGGGSLLRQRSRQVPTHRMSPRQSHRSLPQLPG